VAPGGAYDEDVGPTRADRLTIVLPLLLLLLLLRVGRIAVRLDEGVRFFCSVVHDSEEVYVASPGW
jgi:hypothetical protein